MIDSGREGNIARFMNHSCNPNCETMTWSVNGEKRIGIYSLRDIEPREELTFNYQLMQTGVTKTKCLCNEPNCAGFIGDKIKRYFKCLLSIVFLPTVDLIAYKLCHNCYGSG